MKLWNDFDRRLSAKPSHGGQQVDQQFLPQDVAFSIQAPPSGETGWTNGPCVGAG